MPDPDTTLHRLETAPALQLGSRGLRETAVVARAQLQAAWHQLRCRQSPLPLMCCRNHLVHIRLELRRSGEAAVAQVQMEADWPQHSSLVSGPDMGSAVGIGKALQLHGPDPVAWIWLAGHMLLTPCLSCLFHYLPCLWPRAGAALCLVCLTAHFSFCT